MWWSTHNPQSSPIFVKFVANNVCLFKRSNVKGQLILKVLFCCYRFFQKMNEHFDLTAMIAQIELFSSFLWKNWWHPKSPFEINWLVSQLFQFCSVYKASLKWCAQCTYVRGQTEFVKHRCQHYDMGLL